MVQIPFAEDGYILPRVLLLLVACAVGLLLCSTLLEGPGIGLISPLALPAIAVAVAALLAMALSISPATSLVGQYLRYESAVVRVAYVLLLLVTAWLLAGGGAGDRRRVVGWFLVGCCIASIEALWEWVAFLYGWLGGLARPDGNLGNAALLGVLDAMAVAILLGRVLRREWRWSPILLIVLGGLAASTSRSAWLAALLAGLVVAGLHEDRAARIRGTSSRREVDAELSSARR